MVPEENWFKFYVNPFANLLDENLLVQPVPLRQDNLDLIRKNFKTVRGRTPTYDRWAFWGWG